MTKKIRISLIKLSAGILLPLFLSMSVPQISSAQNAGIIHVVFSIKNNGTDPNEIFAVYHINASKVFNSSDPDFAQIYKADIPADVFTLLENNPSVAYAERDQEVAAALTATDPFFTTDATIQDKQWYLPKTHVPEAWDYIRDSSSVTVAIIDTGIHASHIELNDGRIIQGFNIMTNQAIPANSDSDDNGHGTAVAGIIGAIPNNSLGLAGINWKIKIMPVKSLGADGSGELSAVAAGMVWATDHGANIINLSLGGLGYGADTTLSNAIGYAYGHGVLIVAAAGNDLADQGLNLDKSPVYPVCGDNGANMILGVAATDVNDQKASFSNFGASCIDVSAPGRKILTTAFFPSAPANNVLIYGSGTSLAAPMVSGIAALVKASNPNLSNTDIRNIIIKSADDIYALNQSNCFSGSCNGFLGSGRVNALRAVTPQPINSGSLVREMATGNVYLIAQNTKRLVSSFVFSQRGFDPANVSNDINNQLSLFSIASPLPPLDGTLVKSPNSPEVFIINQELKRPLTYLVFISRGLSFADVKVLSDAEVNGYLAGDWYWPPDGTLVLIQGSPLVYVMDQQVSRPVTYFVFIQRHLSFTKVIAVSADDFLHVPKAPDAYWEPPLEGTLVKSAADPGIYVVEDRTKKLLSYQAFVARGYSFANVKTLPQAEMDIIAPGPAVL